MSQVTYHFNGHSGSDWPDPSNFNDGNIATFASAGSGDIHTFNSNTCPGTNLGIIVEVDIRVYAYGDGNDRIDLTPIFVAGDGYTLETTPVVSPGGWSPYRNITHHPNAPDWSLWSHIQTLGCRAEKENVSKGNTMYGSVLEVRVTYWEPPVSGIDVGAIPVDRYNRTTYDNTYIDKNNPANASGVLHSIRVWAETNITGLRVGTFYTTNGNTLKCRDSELIGDVVAGAERTFTGLSITVEVGDYIGFYCTAGEIERDTLWFDGIWYKTGEYIDPNDEGEYIFAADDAISLYGYGDIGGPPAYYHGLKVQGEGELALCDVGTHPLRIRKGGTNYGIELVETDDPNASRIRIKTPTGVKAIRKYT